MAKLTGVSCATIPFPLLTQSTRAACFAQAGYRNFFASVLAGNQRGFARAVQESGVPRSELFICGSVVSNRAASGEAAYAATKRGCEQNLGAFSAGSIGYLDEIMLDYPGPNEDAVIQEK